MWPWEHLIIGYLAYSLYVHLRYHEPPATGATLILAFGTQFPDLVDKPLAWVFAVLPSGTSLAHSVFVAVPTAVTVVALAIHLDHVKLGVAFAIGYLSHLPADVVYYPLVGVDLTFAPILWPISKVTQQKSIDVIEYVHYLFSNFTRVMLSDVGLFYLVAEIAMLTVFIIVWARDGYPGVFGITRIGKRRVASEKRW